MVSENVRDSILIERYKYVLERRKQLNEVSLKVASVYQSTVVLLAGIQIVVVDRFFSKSLSKDILVWSSEVLLCVNIMISILSIVFIASGVASWVKYRVDENVILSEARLTERTSIKMRNCLSWYETYIVIMMLLVPVGHVLLINMLPH